jgi:hypothetical protein
MHAHGGSCGPIQMRWSNRGIVGAPAAAGEDGEVGGDADEDLERTMATSCGADVAARDQGAGL